MNRQIGNRINKSITGKEGKNIFETGEKKRNNGWNKNTTIKNEKKELSLTGWEKKCKKHARVRK